MQSTFIAGCVTQLPVACHKTTSSGGDAQTVRPAKNNRCKFEKTYSRKYSLPLSDRRVEVCKLLFCLALGISSSRVNKVLENQRKNGGVPSRDNRGHYDHSRQRLSSESILLVENHIKSFPVNESHYTRAHSRNRRYLSSALSVNKMYDLYVEQCQSRDIQPVKSWTYRHVFNTRFNLSFHPPRKDTCKRCDFL